MRGKHTRATREPGRVHHVKPPLVPLVPDITTIAAAAAVAAVAMVNTRP